MTVTFNPNTPPASNAPRSGGKQSLGPVEFQWSPNLEAKTSRLQVARDERFTELVAEREGVEGDKLTLDLGGPGTYFWRLASTRADGDKGPFGDAQRFELRPLPEPPKGGLGEDGKSLLLAWGGRPEDMQHVELARDAQFNLIVRCPGDAIEQVQVVGQHARREQTLGQRPERIGVVVDAGEQHGLVE